MMQDRRTNHEIEGLGKERELKGVSGDSWRRRITQMVAAMIE